MARTRKDGPRQPAARPAPTHLLDVPVLPSLRAVPVQGPHRAHQGHDQEDVAVKDDEEVDAEHLDQTASQGDAAESGGEAEQHGRHHGAGGTDVDSQEQRYEQVHGLVQAPLGHHRVDDQGVGRDDHQVDAEEGQHQEGSGLLQPREAQQDEAGIGQVGAALGP